LIEIEILCLVREHIDFSMVSGTLDGIFGDFAVVENGESVEK